MYLRSACNIIKIREYRNVLHVLWLLSIECIVGQTSYVYSFYRHLTTLLNFNSRLLPTYLAITENVY